MSGGHDHEPHVPDHSVDKVTEGLKTALKGVTPETQTVDARIGNLTLGTKLVIWGVVSTIFKAAGLFPTLFKRTISLNHPVEEKKTTGDEHANHAHPPAHGSDAGHGNDDHSKAADHGAAKDHGKDPAHPAGEKDHSHKADDHGVAGHKTGHEDEHGKKKDGHEDASHKAGEHGSDHAHEAGEHGHEDHGGHDDHGHDDHAHGAAHDEHGHDAAHKSEDKPHAETTPVKKAGFFKSFWGGLKRGWNYVMHGKKPPQAASSKAKEPHPKKETEHATAHPEPSGHDTHEAKDAHAPADPHAAAAH